MTPALRYAWPRCGQRATIEFRHESWLTDEVFDLLREYDPDAGRALLKPELPLPQEGAVRASRTGRIFLNFTRFPYWRAIPSPRLEAGTLVRVSDLRFGMPEGSPFSASFEFDSAGRLVREELAGLGAKDR